MKRIRSPIDLANVVQYIVLANVVIYAIQILMQPKTGLDEDLFSLFNLHFLTWFERQFGLVTPIAIPNVIWQVFTSMFLHGGVWHIAMNMFLLWQFGHALERVWGGMYFFKYYMFTGLGSSIAVILLAYVTNDVSITIGASGAVFGVLLAYGMLFPNNILLMFFAIPMPAKYAVMIFGGIELLLLLTGGLPGISHIGHLGGLLAGFLMLKGRGLLKL